MTPEKPNVNVDFGKRAKLAANYEFKRFAKDADENENEGGARIEELINHPEKVLHLADRMFDDNQNDEGDNVLYTPSPDLDCSFTN